MPIFVVIPTDEGRPEWADMAKEHFGNKCFELPRGEMLVAYEGTSNQLSDFLNMAGSENGGGVVIGVNSYWGYSSKQIWEWFQVNEKQ